MRYSDKLRGKYIDEIRTWQWDKLRRTAELQVPDGCDEPAWINYIGSVLNLYPSGKIYAPWTTNQTAKDIIRDEVFSEALEAVAEEHGAYITSDSGDVFACWPHEDELVDYRQSDGTLERFAWPGGYPLYYLDPRGNPLCYACAALDYVREYSADDRPIAADINWEDGELHCDHCSQRIESAYAEPDAAG